MLVGEIVVLCIIFIVSPIIVFRLIYIFNKISTEKIIAKTNALNKLKSILNSAITTGPAQIIAPEVLKQIKIKKSKILSKLEILNEIISNKTGINIVYQNINDSYLNETIIIKTLQRSALDSDILDDAIFIKTLMLQLIEENNFPSKEDFDYTNSIYKKFKKMPRNKK